MERIGNIFQNLGADGLLLLIGGFFLGFLLQYLIDQSRLRKKNAHIAKLEKDLKWHRDEVGSLQTQLDETDQTLRRVRRQFEALQKDYEDSLKVQEDREKAYDALRTEFEALRNDLNESMGEVDKLSAELFTSQQTISDNESTIEIVRGELAKKSTSLESSLARANSSESSLGDSRAEVGALNAKLIQALDVSSTQAAENDRLRIANSQRELSLQKANDRNVTYEAQLKQLNQQYDYSASGSPSSSKMSEELSRARAELRARENDLKKALAAQDDLQNKLAMTKRDLNQLRLSPSAEPTVLPPAFRSVTPSDPAAPEPVASHTADKDNLTAISGIGPTYNQALVDAGITTFDALARLTDEEVIAIVKPAKWQSIKVDAWIEEAAGRADDKRWS